MTCPLGLARGPPHALHLHTPGMGGPAGVGGVRARRRSRTVTLDREATRPGRTDCVAGRRARRPVHAHTQARDWVPPALTNSTREQQCARNMSDSGCGDGEAARTNVSRGSEDMTPSSWSVERRVSLASPGVTNSCRTCRREAPARSCWPVWPTTRVPLGACLPQLLLLLLLASAASSQGKYLLLQYLGSGEYVPEGCEYILGVGWRETRVVRER